MSSRLADDLEAVRRDIAEHDLDLLAHLDRALAVVRNLADHCPPMSRDDECSYCTSTHGCDLPPFDPDRVRIDIDDLVRPDPSTHAEDCPWRQAVEWVTANT